MDPNVQVSDKRDVPLVERLRQKQQGFVTQTERERAVVEEGSKARRANKNQPLELSSKRAVGRFRQVVESYAFLDEYKQRELQQLKQQLKKTKSVAKKDELKHDIALRQQEMTEKQKREKVQSALTKRKQEEREAVASGKGAFYLKRKDKKKVELHAKFQDLQETGKLSKFMAKKRKKNASKDHRWLPTQRK
ncbi:unnamed protein product [Peronospora destructor]|uniref:rRNA biogenesis protein RRP36 n=1 Tax=Peronospora destructor TaxID=86335 RepID=A0AAV0UB86_9STRA|nr:unnamed protein product [Peronospora destructor]